MLLKYFQKGFNYNQDGPGNRLVYHLQGCNLKCPWCSNPEGMAMAGLKEETVEQAEKYILSARPMFFEGGGITFTGGEATCQFDSVKALLSRLEAAGVNTCIETNATHPRLEELFPLLDTMIADFKHPDGQMHKKWTGLDNGMIRQNLEKAARFGMALQLRTPLIHGVNDDDQALKGFVDFYAGINRPGMTVEFLRYHEYGKEKWQKQGMEYKMENAFVTEERAIQFEQACRQAGITIVRT